MKTVVSRFGRQGLRLASSLRSAEWADGDLGDRTSSRHPRPKAWHKGRLGRGFRMSDEDQANALLVRAAVCLAIHGLEFKHLPITGDSGGRLADALKIVMNLKASVERSDGPSGVVLGQLILAAVELAIAQTAIHGGDRERPFDPNNWLKESFAAFTGSFAEFR